MCNASLGLIRTYYDEGLNEGMIKGRYEGISEGITLERKRNEVQNRQTILNLHNLNLSIQDIATCMNLTNEYVGTIINESLH